jgi:signal transduction histidine kinase
MGGVDPISPPRRVLIVDDDVDFGESLVDLLAAHGYEARAVATAELATTALLQHAAPVAMLDVRLGLSSGVDLLSQLRAAHPNLICVMMTAHVDMTTAIKALRNGAYDYFDKSCDIGELLAVLDRCFEKLQLQEDARRAYEELRVAKEAAEVANRAKSAFLATMSHELRTPLNAVMGFSQMMITEVLGSLPNDAYRNYAQHIFDSAEHLLEIINDILDVSKAEAGKLDLAEELVDIGAAIDSTCQLITMRAETAGVALVRTVAADLPPLHADRRKVKQIVMNLLSNAVKFTPAGGRVEIAAAVDAPAGLTIAVSDTGIGIAKEDIPRVTEPFVQVDSSLSRRHEGTGLGLALVAALAELHGGTLKIDSDLGKGTTVAVTFPMRRVGAAPDQAARKAS